LAVRKFKVFVEGHNFLIAAPVVAAKHGFFTTRFVEALDPDGAENAAVEQLRARQSLRELTLNSPDDPPTMYVTKIGELESFDGLESLDQGLIWYAEDDSSDN
jgi:hypothetical protein